MVDIDRKIELLRQRVTSLQLSERTLADAEEIVRTSGMSAKMVDTLRREWLNDMVSHPNPSEFRLAAADPNLHFLNWLKSRIRHRYHVPRRTVAAVSERYGADAAAKLSIVIWPQEIAWAQRLRIDSNPYTSTKAALFLRESEANSAKVFPALSDIYSDAVTMTGYLDSDAQDLSPDEIRFMGELPDFAPLFLRYASRAYADTMKNMTRDQVERLAARAAAEENVDRSRLSAAKIANSNQRAPLRRSVPMIRSAAAAGLDANGMYLLETAFNRLLAAGEIEIDPGMRTADASFIRLLNDKTQRSRLIGMEPLPPTSERMDGLDIARLTRSFCDFLPSSLKCRPEDFERWQASVVEGSRPLPHDARSDLMFFLLGA